jgi:hypothetical protein
MTIYSTKVRCIDIYIGVRVRNYMCRGVYQDVPCHYMYVYRRCTACNLLSPLQKVGNIALFIKTTISELQQQVRQLSAA